MSKYNISTLAAKLAEKSSLNQTEAELFIRKMFDVANQGLEQDKQVKMRWLGTFKVTSVKDRESINVNTGERIVIEGRDKISFTPDNILKEIVNKPFAQFETVVVNDGVEFDDIDKKFEASIEEEDVPATENAPLKEDAAHEDASTSVNAPISEESAVPNRVASALVGVSADLSSTTSAAVSSVNSAAAPSASAPDVIDFLDTPSSEAANSEVIVIGAEKEENPSEDVVAPSIVEFEDSVEPQEKPQEEPLEEPQMEKQTEQQTEQQMEQQTEQQTEQESVLQEENEEELEEEAAEELRRNHFILPKYLVVAAVVIFVALVGGIGWFAFNYGKMAAQRDHLALQLDEYHSKQLNKQAVAAKPASTPDAQEERLREKARQDSIRMAQASEVIKAAELSEKQKADSAKAAKNKANLAKQENTKLDKAKDDKSKQDKSKQDKSKQDRDKLDKQTTVDASKYNKDARVRTGAYRIVGVAQVVKVTGNQSLSTISNRYLGPGMECYVEALNGTSTVKSGQTIKIPKLELKKKK